MFWDKTNIEIKLQDLKSKQRKEQEILEHVQLILDREALHQSNVLNTLGQTTSEAINDFNFDLLETKNIFHLDQIRQICIDYRLRFLDSRYFKGEIP